MFLEREFCGYLAKPASMLVVMPFRVRSRKLSGNNGDNYVATVAFFGQQLPPAYEPSTVSGIVSKVDRYLLIFDLAFTEN